MLKQNDATLTSQIVANSTVCSTAPSDQQQRNKHYWSLWGNIPLEKASNVEKASISWYRHGRFRGKLGQSYGDRHNIEYHIWEVLSGPAVIMSKNGKYDAGGKAIICLQHCIHRKWSLYIYVSFIAFSCMLGLIHMGIFTHEVSWNFVISRRPCQWHN